MRIVECVILSFVFMISFPHCSSSIIQQQDRTVPPVSAALLAEASVETRGEAENSTKVQQVQKRLRGFSGGRTPLDPLSISPVKPKRDRPRQIKPSQKKRPAADSLDQITPVQTGSSTPNRPGEDISEKSRRNNQQKLEPPQHPVATQRTPTDHVRTRNNKASSRTGFGLPIDRIGLGRLPSGRR